MKKIALILSFVGGATDTLGFSLLYQIFTAHVTGNFVLIGSSFARSGESDQLLWAQLSVLPVFFITVTTATVVIPKKITLKTTRFFLGTQACFLSLFFIVGALFNNDINNLKAMLIAAPAVIAMALQNMYSKTLFTKLPFTTVMTGNVTKIAMDIGYILKKEKSQEQKSLMTLQMFAVIGFISGALLIAVIANYFAFMSALLPVLLILYITLSIKEEHIQ
ncbi:YoaK family protein [Sinomicrobium sp. M5D2P17]